MEPGLAKPTGPVGPSIKGSALTSVVEDLRTLRDAGRIGEERLELGLEAADLALLDEKVAPTRWYPIGAYARMLDLLAEVEGEGDPEGYLYRRGAAAADRLYDSGLYPMLDADTERLGLRALRLFITIADALYNFMKWRGTADEEAHRFTAIVTGARDYPDAARLAAAGFLARGAERVTEERVRVRSERPDPDRVLFHFAIGD